MKRLLTMSVVVLAVACAPAVSRAQTGPIGPTSPGGIASSNSGVMPQQAKLTPDRLANLLRGDGHQVEIKKLTTPDGQFGGHLVIAKIVRDSWRFDVEFEFNAPGTNMNIIVPLGDAGSQFSSAQLLALLKKSYELVTPLHFSYRATDRRLCLEDPNYGTGNCTDVFVRQLVDRMVKTVRDTHDLWDTSRWPVTGGAPTAAPSLQPKSAAIPASTQNLAGSTWIGSETLQGFGRLEFRFQDNGAVVMIDAKGTSAGTYTQNGTSVSLHYENGAVVYTGAIVGQIISGTARNEKGAKWNFSVSR